MTRAEMFARQFGSVDVLTSEFVARGIPRLIPDPREHPGWPLAALSAAFGRGTPRPRKPPTQFVILVHPSDLGRVPNLAKSLTPTG